ncbi:MAG: RHS repeat-associated core domain-containing protein [Verrucomicrobia bacterium]|nr:RHS repeat-associated core domain-containing protein [Verrucomicrobiota bacterium]
MIPRGLHWFIRSRRLLVLLGSLLPFASGVPAWADGVVDRGGVVVKVRGSYTSTLPNPALRLSLFTAGTAADDSAVPEVSLSASTAGAGATEERHFVLPVGVATEFHVEATNLSNYLVTFAVPNGYRVFVDGVEREAYFREIQGSGLDTIEVVLARSARSYQVATRSSAGELGDASPVFVAAPKSTFGQPSVPEIEFNLGYAFNGDPLPPLNLLLNDSPYWGPQGCFERYVHPDVDLVQVSAESFRLVAPQVSVVFEWTGNATPISALPADPRPLPRNFRLRFYENAQSTTEFLSYDITYTVEPVGIAYYYKSATVTKTIGAAQFITRIECATGSGNSWQSADILGSWTLSDWHRGGTPPQRTTVTRQRTAITSLDFDYTDVLNVLDAEGVVARTRRITYRRVKHDYTENGTPYSQRTQTAALFRDGDAYETQIHLDPRNRPIGSVQPSGATAIGEYAGSGATLRPLKLHRTWLDTSPLYSPITGTIFPGGSETTEYLYEEDWNRAPVLPKSIRRRRAGTLVGETSIVYANGTTGITSAAGTRVEYPVLSASRYDFTAASALAYSGVPRAAGDGPSLRTVTKWYRTDTANPILVNRLHSVEHPDFTKTSYAYETGTFVPGANPASFTTPAGTDLRVLAFHGVASGGVTVTSIPSGGSTLDLDPVGLVANQSTRTLTVFRRGLPIRRETYVYTGASALPQSSELIAWENLAYSPQGELVSRQSSTNESFSATWAPDRSTQTLADETGLTTTLTFDAAGRVAGVTRAASAQIPNGLVTTFEYDGDHRVRRIKQGPDAASPVVTERQYNTAGLLEYEIAPGGVTTRYSYPNQARDLAITYHYGTSEAATATITRHADGRTQRIDGSAVVEERYTYDFDASNRFRVTRRLGPLGKRPQVTVFDLAGRVAEESSDGFVGAGVSGTGKPMVTFHQYNDRGLLSKSYAVEQGATSTTPISGDFVREYDQFGRLTAAGLNLDGVAGLQPGGTDRYESFAFSFERDAAASAWWALESRSAYHTNGSAAAHVSTRRSRLGNLESGVLAQAKSADFHGNTSWETLRYASGHRRLLAQAPNGTTLERTFVHGLVTAEKWYDALNPTLTSPALSTTYTYDAHGRLEKAVDGRKQGTPGITYHPGTNRPHQIRDARGVIVATHTYDPAGRLQTTVSPAGTNSYKYDPRSQLVETSGPGIVPTRRTYTAFGELETLKTYRGGLAGAADITTWSYDDNTGWLSAKSDPATRLVTYDYAFEPGYRNVIRTWARAGGTGHVETRYRYAVATSDLMDVDYNDDTPDVAYTYTRTGQVKSVSDASGLRQFHYQREQVSAEYLPPYFNNLVLSPHYQAGTTTNAITGRYAGFRLGSDNDTNPENGIANLDREMAVTYGYDALGRIETVTTAYAAQGSRPALNVPATYRYRGGSAMWDLLTQGGYTLERDFENQRDLLLSITAAHAAVGPAAQAPVTRYGYGTDDAGRRTWATQTGLAFADLIGSASDATYYRYHYDSLGQLANDEINGRLAAQAYRGTNPEQTSVPIPGRGFGYTYDTAGNRSGASLSGTAAAYRGGPAASDSAGGNSLNQVRSRDTLKTRVSGTSAPGATVTVGGVTATRTSPAGRFWDVELPQRPQHAALTVSASLSGQTETAEVRVVTRPAQEALEYDLDGNLIGDSQWVYQWDAENRLKRMYTQPANGWGAPNRDLVFTYDYVGRRIRKESWENGVKKSDRKFIYEGWNLIAELDSATNKVVRSYAWGLDVSSSLTATGGVGALVLETMHSDTTLTSYHVAYDGSGNVAALLQRKPGDVADGKVAASYEYGPFGENVRAWVDPSLPLTIREALASRPFRHATKFTDVESGLVYYGFRYYDPGLGRFLSRDPLGEAGGSNLYGFVGNDPINRLDVLGLCATHPSEDPPKPREPPPTTLGSSGVNLPFIWRRGITGEAAAAEARDLHDRSRRAGIDGVGEGTAHARIRDQEFRRLVLKTSGVTFGTEINPLDYVGYWPEWVAADLSAWWEISSAMEKVELLILLTTRGRSKAALGEPLNIRIVPSGDGRIRMASPQAGSLLPGAARLPDSAIVVRGGINSPQSIANGAGVVVGADGRIVGLSVQSAPGESLQVLANRVHVPHNQIGVTTVGAIRAAGGDVVVTPGRGFHAEVQGLTPEKMSQLLSIQPNPNPKSSVGR